MSDEQRLGKCCHGWENEDGFPAPCYDCLEAEVDRLRTKLREIHQVASDPAFACDAMDRVLVILRRDEEG